MLLNLFDMWNELLIIGVIVYLMTLVMLIPVFIATRTRHTIIGAILALITVSLGEISQIVFKTGIILALARLILIFI